MAIGENSYFNSGSDNNATRRNSLEYSYYSRYTFTSADESVSLRFEFKSGLLQIKLYTRNTDTNGWMSDPSEIIYLSPMKAKMLSEQIIKYKEYVNTSKKIDENVAFGVNGGLGERVSFIAFHSNSHKDIFITIGKFDGNGTITQKLTYQCPKDYNYGLNWKNLFEMDVEKSYYNYVELNMIHQMISDFSRSMSGAIGYGVHDTGRYDLGRILNKMDPIYDQLGIERVQYGGGNRYNRTNNFLNSTGGSSNEFTNTHSDKTTIDDLLG